MRVIPQLTVATGAAPRTLSLRDPATLEAVAVGCFDASGAWSAIDGRSIDVRAHGAVFDGRDNAAAIIASIAEAVSLGLKDVALPAGDSLISQTIVVPPGIRIVGRGRNATRLRKTADFGDMFQFGTSSSDYQSGGASGFWAYHDYGSGAFPPTNPSLVTHPCTTGAIFKAFAPSHCMWTDLYLIGGQNQWYSFSGVSNIFLGVETQGVWDPTQTVLQCSPVGIFIDGNASSIPTDFDFFGCWARGIISTTRSISWTGGHTTTTTVQNIGPKDILFIRVCEGIRFHGGYIGAACYNGVRLKPPVGWILNGLDLRGTFVDANGLAGLMLDNQDGGTPTDITWAPSEHNGQSNGLCGLSDSYSNTSSYSVVGLNIDGFYRAFVGPVAELKIACTVKVNASARGWNFWGFYDTNAGSFGYDAAFRIADTCVTVVIDGLIGGGLNGDGSSSHDGYVARYTSAGNPANVTIKAVAGKSTTLSGSL